MVVLGIELTGEDMTRIVSCVGTMAVSMAKNADNNEDMVEAAELCKLHLKLLRGFKEVMDVAKK